MKQVFGPRNSWRFVCDWRKNEREDGKANIDKYQVQQDLAYYAYILSTRLRVLCQNKYHYILVCLSVCHWQVEYTAVGLFNKIGEVYRSKIVDGIILNPNKKLL
jgi:hypothetical protein